MDFSILPGFSNGKEERTQGVHSYTATSHLIEGMKRVHIHTEFRNIIAIFNYHASTIRRFIFAACNGGSNDDEEV